MGRVPAFFIGMLGTLAVMACDHTPTVCPSDLRVTWSPHDTTIAVGERFTASLALFGCAGTQRLTDTVTFASSNEPIAPVGLTSGVVTGLHAGTATITASARHYGIAMPISVTIR